MIIRYKKCFVLFSSKMGLSRKHQKKKTVLEKQHDIPGCMLLLCPVPLEMTPNEPSNKLPPVRGFSLFLLETSCRL